MVVIYGKDILTKDIQRVRKAEQKRLAKEELVTEATFRKEVYYIDNTDNYSLWGGNITKINTKTYTCKLKSRNIASRGEIKEFEIDKNKIRFN